MYTTCIHVFLKQNLYPYCNPEFVSPQTMAKPTPQQERVALRRSLYVPWMLGNLTWGYNPDDQRL